MTQPRISKQRVSQKAASFTESVIREMSREAAKYGAVNLGQGFPDWAAPEDIKQKAKEAIQRIQKRQGAKPAVLEAAHVTAGSLTSIRGITGGGESTLVVGWRLDRTFS